MTQGASDTGRFGWHSGATALALLATLLLLGLLLLVTVSSNARDRALVAERHAYDVTLLSRTVDATISRSEAALGRFVLDEEVETSGNIYYNEWRLAGHQMQQLGKLVATDPEQRARVEELESLYRTRGEELATAARAAALKRGQGGMSLYYAAGQSSTGPALRARLAAIAQAESRALQRQMAETQLFNARADRLTDYLGWFGIFVGIGAIFLGWLAYQALRAGALIRREAESEGDRAAALELAVADRTLELSQANAALKAEAEERMAAEAQLRQVQKMEAVGQLTGGIAHDFNNMLAVVVGGVDLARRRLNGPRREVLLHLNNAMEGATRAAALTRRLLSFARSEPLLPERVDGSALVESMGDLLDRTIGERITVEVDLADDLWPVFVDPHQLENAIVNLAVNARDAMDGTGVLRITTANVTLANNEVGDVRGGDYVRIAVIDNGCGMTAEVRERAFEPFFTTKPVGKGTGLGLSQIFGFAHQSGGEVGIDSQPRRGTTVSIYLPRSRASAAQIRIHPAVERAAVPPAAIPGTRILLVEDDPRVRSATVHALEDLDYVVVACPGGEEALRLFAVEQFELVVSDVIMPEMTGPELVRELKAMRPDTAILFVTGYVGDGDTNDLAGYELLRKPFTVSALADAIGAALSRQLNESPPNEAAAARG